MSVWDDLFKGVGDNDRRGYLRPARVRELLEGEDALNKILAAFKPDATANARLKKATHDEKVATLHQWATTRSDTKLGKWHGCRIVEVIVGTALTEAKLPKALMDKVFAAVDREKDLEGPVAAWIATRGEVHTGIELGSKRSDFIAYKRAKFLGSDSATLVELANDVPNIGKFFEQGSTYRLYISHVYLACTPAVAAAFLKNESTGNKPWSPRALADRLEKDKAGLLIVEDKEVYEVIAAQDAKPTKTADIARILATHAPKHVAVGK